jgi:hypothetical protein
MTRFFQSALFAVVMAAAMASSAWAQTAQQTLDDRKRPLTTRYQNEANSLNCQPILNAGPRKACVLWKDIYTQAASCVGNSLTDEDVTGCKTQLSGEIATMNSQPESFFDPTNAAARDAARAAKSDYVATYDSNRGSLSPADLEKFSMQSQPYKGYTLRLQTSITNNTDFLTTSEAEDITAAFGQAKAALLAARALVVTVVIEGASAGDTGGLIAKDLGTFPLVGFPNTGRTVRFGATAASPQTTAAATTAPSVTEAVCTPASGTLFPIGTTRVTCTATGANETTTTAQFAVDVQGAVAGQVIPNVVPAVAPGSASWVMVTSTADTAVGDANCTPGNCSLRQAISAANGATGRRVVVVPGGTYLLTNGELVVSADMDIRGGDAARTVIDAANASRVFNVQRGTVVIAGITAQRGNGGVYRGTAPSGLGGAILNAGTLTLAHAMVSASVADYGGGILNSATLTLVDTTVARNTSRQGLGAGVRSVNGTLTVTDSTISGNNAAAQGSGTSGGGGIAVSGGTAQVSGSTVVGNVSGGNGAGIFVYANGRLSVANSTFNGNTSSNRGGAIAVEAGSGTVVNSTLAGNVGFGGALFTTGTLSVTNSILAASTLGGSPVNNCAAQSGGVLQSGGNNLSSDGSCGGGPNDLLSTAVSLGPLQSNAPGTTDTMALPTGSPAIGRGNPAVCGASPVSGNDQRGVSRKKACDIGAFESPRP